MIKKVNYLFSKNIKIHNNLDNLNKIIKKKLDYCICAITGIPGLKPTLSSIKLTKKIAIANKESIICAWNLIEKELKKNKTHLSKSDIVLFKTEFPKKTSVYP